MKVELTCFIGERRRLIVECGQPGAEASGVGDRLDREFPGLSHEQYFLVRRSEQAWEMHLKARGGKGGFGSLLRGQPPKKQMTNNFDACRDLTGRRLRHTLQARRMAEWAEKKEEEEKRIEEEVKLTHQRNTELQKARAATLHKLDNHFFRRVERTDTRVAKALRAGLLHAHRARKQTERNLRILNLLSD